MGDRLRSLVCAIAYAKATQRSVYVDWRDGLYSERPDNSFDKLFRLKNISHLDQMPDSDKVLPSSWQGCLPMTFTDLAKDYLATEGRVWEYHDAQQFYEIDRSKDFDADIVVSWSFERFRECLGTTPYYPSWGPFANDDSVAFKRIYSETIELCPNIQNRVDEFAQQHDLSKAVGVHIRAAHEASDRYVAPEVFEAHLKAMKVDAKNTVFLATDNQDVLNHFSQRFPKLVSTNKWYPPSWEPMHLHKDRPDRLKNALEALVDIYLLAQCGTLIYPSGSSFSHFASLISSAPRHRRIPLSPSTKYSSTMRRMLKPHAFWLKKQIGLAVF